MRALLAAGLAIVMVTVGAVSAQAASTTVQGTGSYDKLVVNNGTQNLVFKVFAPGGECDIRYLRVKFRDRDGTRYTMEAGCYPGAVWAASLVRGQTIVDCSGFTLTYNTERSVWTGKIPRTCLIGLGGDVKVTESFVDDYSPMVNEVPPTGYVNQG